MSDESLATRLAVMEEKLDAIKTQQNRFFSHFDSESRAREDLKQRVSRLEERLDSNRWSFGQIIQLVMMLATLAGLFIMILKG